MIKVLITTSELVGKTHEKVDSNSILTWFVANQLSLSFGENKKWDFPTRLEDTDGIVILHPNEKYHCVYVDFIIRIESISNESCLYFKNGSFLKTSLPIDNFNDMLGYYNFFQIHPNHLINAKHLKSLTYCNAFVTLSNSDALPISNGNEKKICEYLKDKPLI